jgi:hypothetical protein
LDEAGITGVSANRLFNVPQVGMTIFGNIKGSFARQRVKYGQILVIGIRTHTLLIF